MLHTIGKRPLTEDGKRFKSFYISHPVFHTPPHITCNRNTKKIKIRLQSSVKNKIHHFLRRMDREAVELKHFE